MDPLAVVEEQMGRIEIWPTSVITDMFHEELKVCVTSRVAAFMYGNGVNLSDVVKLYKACKASLRNVSETHMYGIIPCGIRGFLLGSVMCSTKT